MIKRYTVFCLTTLVLLLAGCSSQDYYTRDDFRNIEKIDAHVHINNTNPIFVEQAIEDNFKLITINTAYPDFPFIEEQYAIIVKLREKYPQQAAFFSTFSMQGWGDAGWTEKTINHLDSTFAAGAIGVKFWKNIGMSYRDKDGELVMLNDPGFDPLFQFIMESEKWVTNHQGEPKNCWLPVEEMTVNNDKLYFQNHPEYYMYLHPEYPSYERLMAVRDSMLTKHPELRYMGCHLASLEWNVDTLAQFLDRFPNAVVDMAARMGQLQAQSNENKERVVNFLNKYQDRILYGTDLTLPPGDDVDWFKKEAHNKWMQDWIYLATNDSLSVPELDHSFTGLKLSKAVLNKIYYKNARRSFPEAWTTTN